MINPKIGIKSKIKERSEIMSEAIRTAATKRIPARASFKDLLKSIFCMLKEMESEILNSP